MIDIECLVFLFVCFSNTIAEQDLSDLIVPPPQCEFVLILFLTLAGSPCFFFVCLFFKLEKLRAKFINLVILLEVFNELFFSHNSELNL